MAKTLHEADTRRVERSLMTFIEGGKYSKDHKPRAINWWVGIVRSSALSNEELQRIFTKLENYPKTTEEKDRFDQAKGIIIR